MAEETTTTVEQEAKGRIVRIVGAVVDVEFPPENMPSIYNALTVNAQTPIGEVKTVLEVAPEGAVLVIESTISPNTVDRFVRPLLTEAGREDVRLVHAPERIIPGNMVYELLHNNRTIGADDPNGAWWSPTSAPRR